MRRQKTGITRQDSRLSVKSLIESIENAQKHAKNNPDVTDSRCSSTSSINSLSSDHPNGIGGGGGSVDSNGDYCFEQNNPLISFSRSQSHHGATEWMENGTSNNNNTSNGGTNNNQVSNRLINKDLELKLTADERIRVFSVAYPDCSWTHGKESVAGPTAAADQYFEQSAAVEQGGHTR